MQRLLKMNIQMKSEMDDFLKKLKNDHHNFDKGELSDHVPVDPFVFFKKWYKEAFDFQKAANAMAISTVDEAGRPSSRIVYLKELSDEGFIFFTNYHSHKGHDLEVNPNISCLFFWDNMERQVRIEGSAVKVSVQESDEYFSSRPRSSQLGAWASLQSQPLVSRRKLEERIHEFNLQYPKKVPRPPHWGGYIIHARRIEFWQGRSSRLHDRIIYEKEGGKWTIYRINP